jgi:hypothetical protein
MAPYPLFFALPQGTGLHLLFQANYRPSVATSIWMNDKL